MFEVLSLVVGFVGGVGGTLYGLSYINAKRHGSSVLVTMKELLVG